MKELTRIRIGRSIGNIVCVVMNIVGAVAGTALIGYAFVWTPIMLFSAVLGISLTASMLGCVNAIGWLLFVTLSILTPAKIVSNWECGKPWNGREESE